MPIIIDFNTVECGVCSQKNKIQRTNCTSCGESLGFPNVNMANCPEEIEALYKRYELAKQKIQNQEQENILNLFEQVISNDSKAIINVSFKTLYEWVCSEDFEYNNYYENLDTEVRDYKPFTEESIRQSVDSRLFGAQYKNIIFAALSIDGKGVMNYGKYSVNLKEDLIKNRSSLLEENSWFFIDKHAKGLQNLPKGYKSDWQNRPKLVVAKLIDEITCCSNSGEFCEIVLENTPKTENIAYEDNFVEVHIFGKLNFNAIDCVKGTKQDLDGEIGLNIAAHRKAGNEIFKNRLLGKLKEKWQEV